MSSLVALLVGAVGLCVMAFYMYQSYRLVKILEEKDHPAHEDAVASVEDSGEECFDRP